MNMKVGRRSKRCVKRRKWSQAQRLMRTEMAPATDTRTITRTRAKV